jgi:hypothetical protein
MESRVQDVTQYYAKFQNILPEKLMTKFGPLLGVADVADVTHVGLDKHLQEQYEHKEITTPELKNTNISNENIEDNKKITSEEYEKESQPSLDLPQAPHVPPIQTNQNNADYSDSRSELSNNAIEEYNAKLLLNQGAYWSGSKWNCKSCKYSYDGPGMIQHLHIEHNQ